MTFHKATLNDVEGLVRRRVAFLKEVQKPETRQISKIMLETSLRNYFTKSLSNDTFVVWRAVYESKIMATSGLCFFQIAPSFALQDEKIAYLQNGAETMIFY